MMMAGKDVVEKKKRKPRTVHNEETLQRAVDLVRSGRMTYRQAQLTFGIPRSTLSDKVNGNTTSQLKGPEPYLGREVEERIASWLKKMARVGYGQTRDTLFDKVQDIVARLNIPTPFPDGRPTKNWYYLFMKRFPYLGIRQAQLLSRERAGVTRKGIEEWYEEFQRYLIETGNIDILQEPNRIFNCDETGFPIAPKPPKIIAERGTPNVYARGSSSKQTITVMLCACAAGYYVKPMIIYPGINFKREFMEKFFHVLGDVEFGRSHNGWMDQELFHQWLQNVFEPTISRLNLKRPVLLIIDGAKVHLSLFASEFCDQHNIIMYTLYPNSTHLIQPLDLALMGSVKANYKRAVRDWIQTHPFQAYDKFAFPETFDKTWKTSATIDNAIKGFRVAGIYPFDPKGLDQRKLFPSELTRDMDPPSILEASVTEDHVTNEAPQATNEAPQATNEAPQATNEVPQATRQNAQKPKQKEPYAVPPQPGSSRDSTNDAETPIAAPKIAAPKIAAPNSIVFGGTRYQLVPIEPKEAEKAPTLAEVLDEVLEVPKSKKNERKSGERVGGLPRAVSDATYRRILQDREEAKRKVEEEKERRKEERKAIQERKKKEVEEKKRKREEEKAMKSLQRKRPKRKVVQPVSSSSEDDDIVEFADDSSGHSSSSSEFYEGSDSRCRECDLRFRGKQKQRAIGCDTEYCRRWFHPECTGIDFAGKTAKQIQNTPFVCKYC